MARVRVVVFVFAALLVAAAPSRYPVPDVFPQIPEVRSQNGIAQFRLAVIADPVTGTPAFSYRGDVGVAPTIRVNPGDRIRLTVQNELFATRKAANNVNIHFHGLTISPKPPGDDVLMTLAHPGTTLHYEVVIPRRQQPGLYWYHPHSHGESYLQVTGGMSGAIVVEGLQRAIPALGRMRERIIVLRDVPTGFFDDPEAAELAEMTRKHATIAAQVAGGDRSGTRSAGTNPCRPESGLAPSLNRQQRAKIGIAPGERQFFRVINAAAARYFDLSVDGSPLEVVALDGVALGAFPGAPASRIVRHILIPPAGRAEFVVSGGSRPRVLRSACVDSGSAGDAQPAAELADLVDPAAIFTQRNGYAQPLPIRDPGPLRASGLHVVPAPPAPRAARTIRFSEDARGFYINGRTFDMMGPPTIVARAGTVEDWTIVNDTDEVHDFHIHQVHFVVTHVNGVATRERSWLDTVNVPPRTAHAPGSVRVLIDFRDPVVRGTFLYHCHILDHEDHGMMATIEVR